MQFYEIRKEFEQIWERVFLQKLGGKAHGFNRGSMSKARTERVPL